MVELFLSADEGELVVSNLGGGPVIWRGTDGVQLAQVFESMDIERIMCSSSIDFAEDYGFASQADMDKILADAGLEG